MGQVEFVFIQVFANSFVLLTLSFLLTDHIMISVLHFKQELRSTTSRLRFLNSGLLSVVHFMCILCAINTPIIIIFILRVAFDTWR